MKPLLYLGCPAQFWAPQFSWEIWIKPEIPLWSKIWVSLILSQLEGNFGKTKCFHEFFISLNSSHDFCVIVRKRQKKTRQIVGWKEIWIKPEIPLWSKISHRLNWKVNLTTKRFHDFSPKKAIKTRQIVGWREFFDVLIFLGNLIQSEF